jgi:hypothetical protein
MDLIEAKQTYDQIIFEIGYFLDLTELKASEIALIVNEKTLSQLRELNESPFFETLISVDNDVIELGAGCIYIKLDSSLDSDSPFKIMAI